jgi:hemerythrin superfamily protein
MTTVQRNDIVQLLEADHRQAESLLTSFENVAANDREQYFSEVVHTLVAHEVAEEVVVYPAIRSDVPNGDAEADARIEEESAAEKLLDSMEDMDTNDPEFAARFHELRSAVLKHAEAEERNVFPLLRTMEGADRRIELGDRYETAKSKAPTHPHPTAPDTPPGNRIVGPIAALFDRARDAAKHA